MEQFCRTILAAIFCSLRLEIGERGAPATAGQGDRVRGDGGFLVNVGMRLIPAGIIALIAGFAFGLALPSGEVPASPGSQTSAGSRVRVASLGTDVAFVSAVEEKIGRAHV